MSQIVFSQNGYRELIEKFIRSKYKVLPFRDYKRNLKPRFVILRHDLDYFLPYALRMAELENQLKVSSTYFVLTRGDFYDPFSAQNRKIIKKIFDLGHEIGIHWNSGRYRGDIAKGFNQDKSRLENIIGKEILSASQHDPTATRPFEIDNYIVNNTYSKRFNNPNIIYVSDSTMKWRQHTPLDLLDKRVNFHFLAHPMWWMAVGRNFDQKVWSFYKDANVPKMSVVKYIKHAKKILSERDSRDALFQKRIK